MLHPGWRLAAIGLLASMLLATVRGQSLSATGSLNTARAQASALLLASGKVLIAGGMGAGGALASAEIYDPAAGAFSPTGSMQTARAGAAAALLPNGNAIVIGGVRNAAQTTTEIYSPTAGSFSSGPALPEAIDGAQAVTLPDGRIWVVGLSHGCDPSAHNCVSWVEIYDPKTNRFDLSGQLVYARSTEAAVTLPDGTVLVLFGWAANAAGATSAAGSVEIYDPAKGASTLAGETYDGLSSAQALLLASGDVLVAGGSHYGTGPSDWILYDPKQQSFSPPAGAAHAPRLGTMTLLKHGSVLITDAVAPQQQAGVAPAAGELYVYDSNLQTFTKVGVLGSTGSTATLLPDGSVLIAGGDQDPGNGPLVPPTPVAAAELFQPAAGTAPGFTLTAKQTQVVVNTGTTAQFEISALTAGGFDSAIQLSCVDTGSEACSFSPASFSPGGSSTLTVSGLDLNSGPTVAIQVDGVGGGIRQPLWLQIDQEPPQAVLSVSTLDFGNENVGSTSGAQTVKLSNAGAGTLHLTGISASGDFTATSTCGASLENGAAACGIEVAFEPNATGTRHGRLEIDDDAPFSPQLVRLSGTGVAPPAPVIELQPASLSFKAEAVGETSGPQTVAIGNTGSADLVLAAISVSGDFAESSGCGSSIAAGKSCAIAVTFSPTGSGNRTGDLKLSDNAHDSPQTVMLTGSGTAAAVPAAAPDAGLIPGKIDFGNVDVGVSAGVQTFTLANSGGAALSIASIAASGGFSESNTCGSSLGAGQSCTISVTVEPSAAGTVSGAVNVSDNAPTSPQSVSLSADAIASAVQWQPASGGATTESVNAGETAQYKLDLSGVGGFTGAVTLSCTGAPANAACTVSPNTAAIAGAPVPVEVSVTTAASSQLPPAPPVRPWRPWTLFAVLGLFTGLSISTLSLVARRSRRAAILASLGIVLSLGLAACGGSAGAGLPPAAGATPAGNYILTVKAATTGSAVGSTQLTLKVQ